MSVHARVAKRPHIGVAGLEEITEDAELGNYLQRYGGGRYLLLRGKFHGSFLDTIPRGYIRKFVLQKWIDDLTDRERELFEQYGRKDEDNAVGNAVGNAPDIHTTTNASTDGT